MDDGFVDAHGERDSPPSSDAAPDAAVSPRAPPSPAAAAAPPQPSSAYPTAPVEDSIATRLAAVERHNRRIRRLGLATLVALGCATAGYLTLGGATVHRSLLESRELELLDASGRSRAFVRVYANAPVMQLLDAQGKVRLSLGLRFDDTPFIELSDDTGTTRASLKVGSGGDPELRMYNGDA
jgi:hypothetical protein